LQQFLEVRECKPGVAPFPRAWSVAAHDLPKLLAQQRTGALRL
jgi:hypothetical protein